MEAADEVGEGEGKIVKMIRKEMHGVCFLEVYERRWRSVIVLSRGKGSFSVDETTKAMGAPMRNGPGGAYSSLGP